MKERENKIILNPRYKALNAFVAALPSNFDAQGELLYDGRNTIKSFPTPDGSLINVKRYHKPSLFNRLVYSCGLRKPKGLRAFLYPMVLKSKGIETPEQVAYIEQRDAWGFIGYTFFAYINCPYEHNLYELGWENNPVGHEKARALARFTARMHDQGVLHRDYSPGNILWKKDEQGYHFALIDINRMSFGKVGIKQGCANFARLWGEKDVFKVMAHEYARCRHLDVDTCEHLILKYRAQFWTRYKRHHGVAFKLDL